LAENNPGIRNFFRMPPVFLFNRRNKDAAGEQGPDDPA
jgi:hypothetical protein